MSGGPSRGVRRGAGSACREAGEHTAVPADPLDVDGEGNTLEATPFDLDGNPRCVDDANSADYPEAPGSCGPAPIVEMGAYEFQDCGLMGDINGDLLVNGVDIQGFVECAVTGAATGGNCACADLDGMGGVTVEDVGAFVTLLLAP